MPKCNLLYGLCPMLPRNRPKTKRPHCQSSLTDSCLIEPHSDPLVLGDHVDALRDDAICHLESVLSSHHIEEKITDGQRSRYIVRVAEQEYVVQNPTDKPAVFIVHHEIPENWIVDSDPQPSSMDGSTAVFRLNAEPGQRVRLHVGMHRSDSIRLTQYRDYAHPLL